LPKIPLKSETIYPRIGQSRANSVVQLQINRLIITQEFIIIYIFEQTKNFMRKVFSLLVFVFVISNLSGQNDNLSIKINLLQEDLVSIEKMDSLGKEIKEAKINERVEKAKTEINFKKLTLDNFLALTKGGVLYNSNNLRKAVYPALTKLSKAKTLSGAVAAAYRLSYFPEAETEDKAYENSLKIANDYKALVIHPAIKELMISEEKVADIVFMKLQQLDIKAIAKSKLIYSLSPILDYKMNQKVASVAYQLFDEASNPEAMTDPKTIETIRKKLVDITKVAIENRKDRKDHLENIVQFLEGNFARGELIGKQAPAIDFKWYSPNPNIKTLADLKGKVVIVDFWTTWCGPCVGSFPNVVKLQERYKDYPVEILGITSIQGYHMDRINKKRIKLPGKPEEEIGLMPQFMKEQGMTWSVAFSEEDVFNTDFGVRGIPHVAIIDPAGIVRYNMLRPYDAPHHEADKVDAILKEFKLATPSTPMDKTNYNK
jgi:thiol-disulfide isomerase/thioredoxin